MITEELLKDLLPNSTKANRDKYLPYFNIYMKEYGIVTKKQITAFFAQIGHESINLRYAEEIWGPTRAQDKYEGRKDLGNTYAGDGYKYRGRGLIQITGRYNYDKASKALYVDLITNPDLLSQPELAVKSACWWWSNAGLNEMLG